MTKRIAAFLGVSFLVVASVVACSSSDSGSSGGGGGFSCDSKSKCSADPATDKTSCENELKGSCATEYKAFGNCTLSKQTCTADNKTDAQALLNACKSEFEAYAKCKQGGGGKDGG
jgi:hypothetical protein